MIVVTLHQVTILEASAQRFWKEMTRIRQFQRSFCVFQLVAIANGVEWLLYKLQNLAEKVSVDLSSKSATLYLNDCIITLVLQKGILNASVNP